MAIKSTNEANKADRRAIKQSMLLRCLWYDQSMTKSVNMSSCLTLKYKISFNSTAMNKQPVMKKKSFMTFTVGDSMETDEEYQPMETDQELYPVRYLLIWQPCFIWQYCNN